MKNRKTPPGIPRKAPTKYSLMRQVCNIAGLPRPKKTSKNLTKRELVHILSLMEHNKDLINKLRDRCRDLERNAHAD